MKPTTKFIFSVCMLFLGVYGLVRGQVTVENEEGELTAEELVGLEEVLFIGSGASGSPNSFNEVYIEQVGSNNWADISSNTNGNLAQIYQNGSENQILLSLNTNNFLHQIIQNGNSNQIFEFTNSPGMNIEALYNQSGDNNALFVHGRNSLSEKITVNMSGDQTLIIRSY